MSERKGILGAGNWIVDHVKVIDAWPNQDTLANIISDYRGTGGSPCNVLIDLAKLGADFPLTGAGIIGQDEPGDWILETCKNIGVNTDADPADKRPADFLHRRDDGREHRKKNFLSSKRRQRPIRRGLHSSRYLRRENFPPWLSIALWTGWIIQARNSEPRQQSFYRTLPNLASLPLSMS